MKLVFDWDADKAKANLKRHKVSFEEAKTVFYDPFLLTFPDPGTFRFRATVMKGMRMKRKNTNSIAQDEDLRPEYDFANMPGGVRGKYHAAYREGHTVRIHQTDGAILEQHFTLEDGAVMLAPDVRKYFRDSEAVNTALRCLIPLLQQREHA